MQAIWWRLGIGGIILLISGWVAVDYPWSTQPEPAPPSGNKPLVTQPVEHADQPEQVAVIPEQKPLPEALPVKPTGPQRSPSFSLTDEEVKGLVFGTWEQEYYGRRMLTVREDGTATMKYFPAGMFRQKIYGTELIVEFDWTLRDGVITLTSTGGSPASKIQLATAIYGKERVQPIVELTADTFQLMGVDGKEPDPAWKRVTQP